MNERRLPGVAALVLTSLLRLLGWTHQQDRNRNEENTVAEMTTFTAPNGQTRKSRTMNYTCALVVFNPGSAAEAPAVRSWHHSTELAAKKSTGWGRLGYRFLIVPVTTDGATDAALAADMEALRTPEDIADIPTQRIAAAGAAVARAEGAVTRYTDSAAKGPQRNEFDGSVYLTQEDLDGFAAGAREYLAKKQDELAAVIAEYATPALPVEEPVVVEKPKKMRKLGRRAQFIKDVVAAITDTPADRVTLRAMSVGAIQVSRDSDLCTDLTISEPNGNSFEINYPFKTGNAKKIAALLWELRSAMAV